MRSTRQQARFAGRLYLFMLVTGLPGLLLIPPRLIVEGNVTATADHLRAASTLFRIAIASELFHQAVFLFLALALYRLFESVNRNVAVQLVALVAVSIPIMFLNVVNELAALILVGGPTFLSTFTKPQLDSLAYLFLNLHGEGIGVVEVFWGLWLVPFGLLVIRSGFIPKILGVLLLIGALGNLIRAVASLFPALHATLLDPLANILAAGELPIIVWLPIWGTTRETPPAADVLRER